MPNGDPAWVGPYRIVARLGAGGMGWVYLGKSKSGRTFAVKVVRPEFADDPSFRARFAQEIAAARKVGGAYTAAVVDADPDAEMPWLATVYVAGPSLEEAVERYGVFGEPLLLRLTAELTEALQAIHTAGVVHRDLKPSNVLLAEDGLRVIDFGVSLVDWSSGLTQPGMVIGTPIYMAPEQVRGEPATAASDIFALGGVVYFAATGRAPFGRGYDLFGRILDQTPELGDVPHALRDLLTACLRKQPGERPVLADVLGRLSAGPAGDQRPEWPVAATRADDAVYQPKAQVPDGYLDVMAVLEARLTEEHVISAAAYA